MTPTPPSTGSSSAGQSPNDAQYRVVRKRNRVPLSCGPCRHRKLKCNRGHPCDNCTKRGDTGSCTYATPGSRKKSSSSSGSTNSPDDMQNRIDRLEGLVLSLMTNGAQSQGPTAAAAAIANSMNGNSMDQPYDLSAPESIKEETEDEDESEVNQVTKSIGVMKVDNNKAIFASEAHWYAILGEISEVKNYFSEHKKQYDDHYQKFKAEHQEEYQPGTAFLFGAQKPTTHAEILAAFPLKPTADILITRYFNTYDPGLHIIHGHTFQKQYDKHWANPTETPIIWLGLAYAMMCMALQSYSRAGDEPPEYRGKSWEVSSEYRTLTAQCLVMADITQPITNMLETLILHVYADYGRSADTEVGVLISIGIIVRLAMRMGYHRDSAPYPGITTFQGEMRRRVWAVVRFSDLLFSAQAGMPPIIRARDTNTELPRNLYDDELFEDMKVLPPSHPDTEATPVSYLIIKARMVALFGEVVELTSALTCSSYEEVMKLDQQLRDLRASLPPHLALRSLEESARDTSTLIMQRFTLDLLYLKSLCFLHRKFLPASRVNTRFAFSRTACIDSSMTMLQHQVTLEQACRPGGRLRSVKWFISSLTTVDFLLAAMTVCSDLYHTAQAERSGRQPPSEIYVWSQDRRDEMMAALERAVGIWDSLKDHSMEAYKAHGLLNATLEQLRRHDTLRKSQQNFSGAAGTFPSNGLMEDPNVAPEHSAAMTLGMLSTGGLTPNPGNPYESRPYPASMGNILNDVSNQPSGLTANYNGGLGNPQSGPENAPSPFSSLFGPSLGFQNIDLPSTNNIDWDAWDSYIQGPGLDATNQGATWMPMDFGGLPAGSVQSPMGMQTDQNQQHQQQNGQGSANAFSGNGGVFMGVSTPPRGSMM
ncbi:uncharacterized protein BDZ99DRAFT_90074 [Mytilinidion resinicola]|uniref:Zn(2)-C6 fungal-type domain-containing protein n=1 Tax=Mytilinidion resinicola TaxID=574789 RepID=A0A6A6YDW7_9PEZI|nr:uncharacterized protein BDZ99DRAFT_90074 [Mytilinidion resinicola]KAF2807022.1 hypothetical protein BDZ99DRAFT_90074 [Mytilinidion resinicola]